MSYFTLSIIDIQTLVLRGTLLTDEARKLRYRENFLICKRLLGSSWEFIRMLPVAVLDQVGHREKKGYVEICIPT